MYKHKYNKYKYKFLKLKKELKNQLGGEMGSELIIRPLEDRIEHPYYNSMGYTNVSKSIPQTNRIQDNSIIDFQENEVFYKLKKLHTLSDREYTTSLRPNMFSILKITNVDTFDKFTDKYGSVIGVDVGVEESIKIDWDRVSADFAGIYLSPSDKLQSLRFDKAPYNNKMFESWWEDEWDTDDVIVFTKSDVPHIKALLPDNPTRLELQEESDN